MLETKGDGDRYVGGGFGHFGHQHSLSCNIQKISPALTNRYQLLVTNITVAVSSQLDCLI